MAVNSKHLWRIPNSILPWEISDLTSLLDDSQLWGIPDIIFQWEIWCHCSSSGIMTSRHNMITQVIANETQLSGWIMKLHWPSNIDMPLSKTDKLPLGWQHHSLFAWMQTLLHSVEQLLLTVGPWDALLACHGLLPLQEPVLCKQTLIVHDMPIYQTAIVLCAKFALPAGQFRHKKTLKTCPISGLHMMLQHRYLAITQATHLAGCLLHGCHSPRWLLKCSWH